MMKSAHRYVCAALLFCAAVGCQQQYDPQANSEDLRKSNSGKTVSFADHEWTLAGPCQDTGDIFRPSMAAVHYTTNEDRIRLIELVVDKSSPLKEGVFSRILGVQINTDGGWISHGPRAEWDLDGGRGEARYVYGELHGTQRHWYPNGQLHIEREWANGQMHGRGRGWYSSGKPQYDSQNINGKEVSGTAWDEDGQAL
jgi:hypothetical protein